MCIRDRSYRELDEQANRLAHHLVRIGVGHETMVGVALERSPELFVAVLAILKAGACYVPLDPTYPAQRLSAMLADSAVGQLLTLSLIHIFGNATVAGAVARAGGRWTLFSACPDADHVIAAAIPALTLISRAQVRCFQVGGASLAASGGMLRQPTKTQEGSC